MNTLNLYIYVMIILYFFTIYKEYNWVAKPILIISITFKQLYNILGKKDYVAL